MKGGKGIYFAVDVICATDKCGNVARVIVGQYMSRRQKKRITAFCPSCEANHENNKGE